MKLNRGIHAGLINNGGFMLTRAIVLLFLVFGLSSTGHCETYVPKDRRVFHGNVWLADREVLFAGAKPRMRLKSFKVAKPEVAVGEEIQESPATEMVALPIGETNREIEVVAVPFKSGEIRTDDGLVIRTWFSEE